MVTFCSDMQASPLEESAEWLEWELLVIVLE
jgi:hypothetical protein